MTLKFTEVVKDSLCRYNLPLSKLRGQCYDGASVMQGAKSGTATRILVEEPQALYTPVMAILSTLLPVMP